MTSMVETGSARPSVAAITFVPKLLGRLGDDRPDTRFSMTIAWVGLGCFLIVDTIWLSLSRLSFSSASWTDIFRLLLSSFVTLLLCGLISNRLMGNPDRIAGPLRDFVQRIALLATASLVLGLLGAALIVFCYLGTGAALPLQDALLAAIDRRLGFDWVGFVKFVNSSSTVSCALVMAYQSTGYLMLGTVAWLAISGQDIRLAEFLALSSLTSLGIAIGMMILPAAGAYSYYQPAHGIFSNFSHNAGMWHYQLLMSLRTVAAPAIDFATPYSNCLVTFPSGHTILAVIITYALRGSRWTLGPALLINVTTVVSTIPEGGHHFSDLIVGGLIAGCAIAIVRIPHRAHRNLLSMANGSLAGA